MLPLILQIEDTEARVAETIAFERSPVRVGRNPFNDLRLDEPFVSQWHAVIRMTDARTTFLDLGATNKTYIDGVPIERNQEVEVNQDSDVRIGSLRLHFIRAAAPPEMLARRPKSAFDSAPGADAHAQSTRTAFLSEAVLPLAPKSEPQAPPAKAEPPAAKPAQRKFRTLVKQQAVDPSGEPAAPTPQRVKPPRGQTVALGIPAVPKPQAFQQAPADSQVGTHPPATPPSPDAGTAASGDLPTSTGAAAAPGLNAAYSSYNQARTQLLTHLRGQLEAQPAAEHSTTIQAFLDQYPLLGHDPELSIILQAHGVAPAISGALSGQPELKDWFRRLTDGLFPPPGTTTNLAMAMERVGELLEIWGQAFVEHHKAHRDFLKEMSLDSAQAEMDSFLHRNEDPRALLAYLLNRQTDGPARPADLQRALGYLAVHQVALVSAVVEGARSILEQFSPQALEQAGDKGQKGLLQRLWPGSDTAQACARCADTYADLAEDDRFTRTLFGREFARRYYSVMGENHE